MINTWAGRSQFDYRLNTDGSYIIFYGTKPNKIELTKEKLLSLTDNFSGSTIRVSSSRTEKNLNSLEEWLQNNVSSTSISSYVAALLVNENMAVRTIDNQIKFNEIA